MGWLSNNSYKKSAYKDGDSESFKFMRKKKSKKTGPLGVNRGVAVKAMVDVNKKQTPLK